MENKDTNNTWRWMRKSDLKGRTKALICSAQEQSIRTNYINYNIDRIAESPFCRICDTTNKTISHIVSECGKLAQKERRFILSSITIIVLDWRSSCPKAVCVCLVLIFVGSRELFLFYHIQGCVLHVVLRNLYLLQS